MRNAAHLHRTTDPETSRQAAELAALITEAHEDRILWTLEKAGRRADAAMTAEEIAEACGFAYAEHMIPLFARYHGSTPAAYRRHLRGASAVARPGMPAPVCSR